MNTKNIKAVIFDMDGTLIDTENITACSGQRHWRILGMK